MKYQLVCPKCRHEFAYDNGYYDKHITRLGNEIHDIDVWLARYRTLSNAEKAKQKAYRDRLRVEKEEKLRDLSDLKAIRKVCDQQVKSLEYLVFKELVKERFGEAAYRDLLDKTTAEIEAYKASGLMRHEYSRRGGGSVTSINKL